MIPFSFAPRGHICAVVGHYGAGKTNFSVNLALWLAGQGRRTAVIDFDFVNPYFCAAEDRELLRQAGIALAASPYTGSNLDAPSIPPQTARLLTDPAVTCVIDAGGDDAGATALGSFADQIRGAGYEMLYVVNRSRPMTAAPEQAAALLREIEGACRLRATGIVGNTHLGEFTDAQTVADGAEYAKQVAALTGLPLAGICVMRGSEAAVPGDTPVFEMINVTQKYER